MVLCACRCLGKEDTLLRSKAQITRGEVSPVSLYGPFQEGLGYPTPVLCQTLSWTPQGSFQTHRMCVSWGCMCHKQPASISAGKWCADSRSCQKMLKPLTPSSHRDLSKEQKPAWTSQASRIPPSWKGHISRHLGSASAYFKGLKNKRTSHHKPPNLSPSQFPQFKAFLGVAKETDAAAGSLAQVSMATCYSLLRSIYV